MVAAEDIAPLKVLAENAGLDFTSLLNSMNSSDDLLNDSNSSQTHLKDYFRILGRISAASKDEACQLSLRPLKPGTTNFVLSTLTNNSDLHNAMKHIARSYNLVHGGDYNRVEKRRNGIVYIIDDKDFPFSFDERGEFTYSLMESILILVHALLSHATGKDLFGCVRKIYTKRSRMRSSDSFLKFWNSPVQCNSSHYGILYDSMASEIPIRFTDNDIFSSGEVYEIAANMISLKECVDARPISTATEVINALEAGIINQSLIANRLGFSVATLRRYLAAEGVSYRELRHCTLNNRAQTLLRRSRHASDVAHELGFSDCRSFSRAFKQWNGMTPSAFAKSISDGADTL